jgi:drug/metabolite transporter (DMT)-like permease
LVLDEVLTQRDLIGSVLILGGMLVSQFFARQTEQGEISGDCDQPGHS